MVKTFGKAAIGTAVAVGVLLAAAPAASAGTDRVCNAAFCNDTTGSGEHVTKIVATKRGDNLNVLGFFEVFAGSLGC